MDGIELNCTQECQSCELLDFAIRCLISEDSLDALTSTSGGGVPIPEDSTRNEHMKENGLRAIFEHLWVTEHRRSFRLIVRWVILSARLVSFHVHPTIASRT